MLCSKCLTYSLHIVGSYLFSILLIVVFFFFFNLFLAVLGLHCCTWALSSCGEQGLLFVAIGGLLIVVASLVAERGL